MDDPDARLLIAYAAGDAAAARRLTDRLAPRLLAMARRALGDDAEAEDVVQEAMLRLWRKAPQWRMQADGARVSTWVARVALNLATDRLRRRRGVSWEVAFEGGGEPRDDTSGEDGRLLAAARAQALRAAMAALPERQAQALVLRHFEEMGNPEIAELLGVSVEAVESLLSRGRRALRVALSPRREELSWHGASLDPVAAAS